MKIAVSMPDDVFERAERLAKRTKQSRSRVYAEALEEYLTRHSSGEVTEAVNRACDEIGPTHDPFTTAAAGRVLARTEW